MRARVIIIRENEIVSDKIWKRKSDFLDSLRSFYADSIRLDAEISSQEDIDAIEKWLEHARICLIDRANTKTNDNLDELIHSRKVERPQQKVITELESKNF